MSNTKEAAVKELTLSDIYDEILVNRSEITASSQALAQLAQATTNCLESLNKTNSRLTTLESKVGEHSRQLEALGRSERRNNVIFFNIPEEDEKNKVDLATKLINILGEVDIQIGPQCIIDCFRIGKKSHNRPVVLKLTSSILKQAILVKKAELSENGYHVKQDRSQEERKFLNEVTPYMTELRKLGKKPFIKYGRVIVDDVAYSTEELKKLIEGTSRPSEAVAGGKRKPEEVLTPTKAKLLKFAFRKSSSVQGNQDISGSTSALAMDTSDPPSAVLDTAEGSLLGTAEGGLQGTAEGSFRGTAAAAGNQAEGSSCQTGLDDAKDIQ